jgi:spore coat polysaccharide biosynthesis protein SpsF
LKTGILLSVRNKATRLPGKVMKPLGGLPVTTFLLRSLKTSAKADMVVLATSPDPRDESLCVLAQSEGVAAFRGSEDDKLVRYRDAARQFGLDFVVVVDGDDPFMSVDHIDRIIAHAEANPVDYCIFGNLPLGATGFGVRQTALERICAIKTQENTEVWGHLFARNPEFRCVELTEDDPVLARPEIRMTLDYEADYRFFSTVVDGLASEGKACTFTNIMAWLALHPEAPLINRDAQSAYEAHLRQSAE